jgi:hypothetical protein
VRAQRQIRASIRLSSAVADDDISGNPSLGDGHILKGVRKQYPTGLSMDLENLPEYWRKIDALFERLETLSGANNSTVLSAKAFDEAQIAGRRTYMEVTRYLGVARDNHQALLALLEHHGATLWAPWSLLRPTFEASFYACWILDPEDGRKRRGRGLRCEILDAKEQRKHRAAFRAFPEADKLIDEWDQRTQLTSVQTYKDEAVKLGTTYDKLQQSVNVTDELPRLSAARLDRTIGPFFVATWRMLSGFEHGLGWAMLAGSDKTQQTAIDGGYDAHFVINDQAFVNAAKTTYYLLVSACELLIRRSTEPPQRTT